MKLSEIVKAYRAENNVTMQRLADESGLSKGLISQIENEVARRQGGASSVPKLSTLRGLAHGMGISVQELMEKMDADVIVSLNAGEIEPAQEVSVKYADFFRLRYSTNLAAGSMDELDDADPDAEVYVPIKFQGKKDRLRAFKVSGESMNRVFPDGSIVVVEQPDSVEQIHPGDIVVAFTNGEATIKRFSKAGNLVILLPDSTDERFQPIVLDPSVAPVEIIGKAVWHSNPDNISDMY